MKSEGFATIATNIKKYRLLNGLTQDEMAKRLGIDSQYYSQLEQGRRNFTLERIIDVCSVLDLTIDRIISSDILDDTSKIIKDKEELISLISNKLNSLSHDQLLILNKFTDALLK
ncbi:MAG: helix-turn-helix domain-containing protein [Acetatifactor sp.]|nr:helix-turn-helix domain-containing protein [Acetatifactor sp.]